MATKIIKIYEEAINEILVAATDLESDVEATDPEDKEDELEEAEEDDDEQQQQQQSRRRRQQQQQASAENYKLQKVAITSLGSASRKEHQYSSFCWSSKRCEKR